MSSFSGKFVLRIPPLLHKKLKTEALQKGVSLNQYVLEKLQRPEKNPNVEAVQKTFKESLLAIVLFGSKVRGENLPSSDEDLLLVLEPSYKIDRNVYTLWDQKIAPHIPPDVSPQFVSLPSHINQAGSLWFEVALEGQVLYEKGSEVSRFLSKLKKQIFERQFVRKWSHGHPYWVRMTLKEKHAK